MPAASAVHRRRRTDHSRPCLPFAFITIACGAISGFHALIASGTTPKMIDRESDIRPIGYGAMLIEGVVGVMALVAATAMFPGDYFAINTAPATFANLGIPVVNLPELESAVGETVAGRPGGAVSLAVGIAQIFSGLPGMRGLMDYWYHFAIMFEALFILTTIDTGTRVARFLVQEFLGQFYAPMARQEWLPGSIVSTLLVVCAWGYFIWTGSISTIWPMFGIANQLLAVGRARRRHDDHHQQRQGALCVGDARAAVVRVGDDADGGRAERADELLADGDRAGPGPPLPGLSQHRADGHDDGVRRRHSRQRRVALRAGAHGAGAGAGRRHGLIRLRLRAAAGKPRIDLPRSGGGRSSTGSQKRSIGENGGNGKIMSFPLAPFAPVLRF